MKTNIFFSALLYFIIAATNQSFSLSYETISGGDWDDPMIWSTDGGASSCNCSPPTVPMGDVIDIYHIVNMTDHLYISGGSTLTVKPYAQLIGPSYKVAVRTNGTVNFFGASIISELSSGKNVTSVGGTINIHYSTLEINGRIEIFAGNINMVGALVYLHVGNFTVYPSATFFTSNGAKLEIDKGNIENWGVLEICASCCIESQGNWTNENTGTVTGGGSAITNAGNMRNYNTLSSFSSAITWCSAGNDEGMPSTEDCSTPSLVCDGVQLPIELSLFEGTNRREYNELIWTTTTESNNDYFILEKSLDALNWEEIYVQDGSGSSNSANNYIFEDYNPEDLTYYRLTQVDFNSTLKKSNIISLFNTHSEEKLKIYPNPSNNSGSLSVTGLNNDGAIIIYNNSGQKILSKIITENKEHNTSISTEHLSSGIYILEYNSNEHKSIRSQFIIL